MLRAAVALVLLANLVFFGWAQGAFEPAWPAPRHAEAEPQRLARQLRADAVTVLTPKAASAAITAARAAAAVCLQAGPLPEADLPAAQAALAAAALPDGSLQREPAAPPPPWLVYVGRWPDAATRRAREAELRKQGLAFEEILTPAELVPGAALSRHASREDAEVALAALAASQPVRGARVLAQPPPPPQFWLRVPKADVDQQARLLALPPEALAGGFRPCAAPT